MQWNFKILVDEDVENDNKEWQGPMGDNDEMGSNGGMTMDTKKDVVWGALKGMPRVLGKMMSTLRRDQFEPPPMQRR
jgi:hypothetical protein